MTAVARVYRWEVTKLLAQKRTYLGLGAALIVPVIFVVVLVIQSSNGPTDVPLGRYLRQTGLATQLGTVVEWQRGGVDFVLAGSLPPAAAEAAARSLK